MTTNWRNTYSTDTRALRLGGAEFVLVEAMACADANQQAMHKDLVEHDPGGSSR